MKKNLFLCLLLCIMSVLFTACTSDPIFEEEPEQEQEQEQNEEEEEEEQNEENEEEEENKEEEENEENEEEEEEEEDDFEFNGVNYFTLNGEIFDVELDKTMTLSTPTSLNCDAFNVIVVNIDPEYTISFNEEEFKNGATSYLKLDELASESPIEIVLTNKTTQESNTSYISTYPSGITIGTVTSNNPTEGFYYYDRNNYCIKLNTKGELIYYRYADNATYFNRTEINGVVYYSFMESTDSNGFAISNDAGTQHVQAVVMDENYQVIDRVTGTIGHDNVPDGHPLDNHQFQIFDLGHYTVSAYILETVSNIPSVNGNVKVVASVAQEIKDGKVLWQWHSTQDPQFYALNTSASFSTNSNSYTDYAHLNSVAKHPDGNFLVSLRGASSVVKLSATTSNVGTADVIWMLCGTNDDFNLTSEQTFKGQHDIKFTSETECEFTLFNNNNGTGVSNATAEVRKFKLNEQSMTVENCEVYKGRYTTTAEGACQELSTTGHYLVSWGMITASGGANEYLFAEENFLTGEVLFGVSRNVGQNTSYKAYKYDK